MITEYPRATSCDGHMNMFPGTWKMLFKKGQMRPGVTCPSCYLWGEVSGVNARGLFDHKCKHCGFFDTARLLGSVGYARKYQRDN